MPTKRTRGPERNQPTARGTRAARAWAGLTAAELARDIGRSSRTLDRWEAGETVPHRNDVTAIAAACGVPDWLAAGHLPETHDTDHE